MSLAVDVGEFIVCKLANLRLKTFGYLGTFQTLQISFILVCSLIILRRISRKLENLPPGPIGWPIIGCLASINAFDVHCKYLAFAKQYGKLFSIRMGQKDVVIITDAKIMKEAFIKEEFSGRPVNAFMEALGGYGIVNTDGNIWKEQRRFLHSCFRKFGMTLFNRESNDHLQSRIMFEVHNLLDYLMKNSSQKQVPLNLNQPFAIAISNVICSILMGVRFDAQDNKFKKMMFNIEEGFRLYGRIAITNFFPFLKFLPWFVSDLHKIMKNRQETQEFFQKIIDEHRQNFDKDNPRDVLDYYLIEIRNAELNGNSDKLFEGKDHDSQMRQILADIFTAGMETTKTALHWMIIYMLHFPDVAKNIRDELDQVVGRKRLPNYNDLKSLPYTEATILEVLRKSSVVPIGNPHATTKDITFRGYHIPKNTDIVPLVYAVNTDPELWEQPDEFKPERFLNEQGFVVKPEYFIPFGVGRRNCLGECLARMEIFMLFTSVLHTFNFKIPEGQELPSLIGVLGVTLSPTPYEVLFEERPLDRPLAPLKEIPHSIPNNA